MWVYYLFPPFSLSFFLVTLAGFSTFLLVSDIAYKKWKRLLMKSPSSRDGSLSPSSTRQMESGWGVRLRAWTHSGRYEAQLPLGPGPQASQRAHGAHGAPSPFDLPKRVLDSDLYLSTKTAERSFSSPEGFLISLWTFQPMQLHNLATTLRGELTLCLRLLESPLQSMSPPDARPGSLPRSRNEPFRHSLDSSPLRGSDPGMPRLVSPAPHSCLPVFSASPSSHCFTTSEMLSNRTCACISCTSLVLDIMSLPQITQSHPEAEIPPLYFSKCFHYNS